MRLPFVAGAILAALITAGFGAHGAAAQMRGHGGPVRALAISPDGATALSGSFDSSAIRWSLASGTAQQILRFHEGAINAVALLPDNRAVTAGEDGRIALWTPGKAQPDPVLTGHTGPVVALAVSPEADFLASGSWDGTVRLWPLGGRGTPTVLETQQQNVNAVAFSPDGQQLVSAGYDGMLRFWPVRAHGTAAIVSLPTPLNAVAVMPSGEIVTAGADGKVYRVSPAGEVKSTAQISDAPITALAAARDGSRLAATSIRGAIIVLDGGSLSIVHELGGGGPVWAVAFLPDGKALLTGGADRMIRRWEVESGRQIGTAETRLEDPLAAYAGDPGAELFRACIACHTLNADEGNRAGPSLHGIFGRHIASLPGYNFSPALRQLDIVWTPQTLAKLLELGPARYTPGTKMPEQRIGNAADRDALIAFLQRASR